MVRSLVLTIALIACGKRPSAPDAAAICAGTAKSRGAIVLRAGDPAAGGQARGLRELAARAPNDNGLPLAELGRFMAANDGAAIFTAHVEERERRLREDLDLARAIIPTMQAATPVVDLGAIDRFPVSPRGATPISPKASELLKPFEDGSALRAVAERATSLAAALRDLANKIAALDTETDLAAANAGISDAIKIANVAHGKLNEVVASLHANAASVAALADEQDGRAFAAKTRLWTRLTAITARLADPWPQSVLTARTRAFVIAGPRQWVVTCSAPRPLAVPPAIVAALPPITGGRDALTVTLGHQPAPATPAPAPTLAELRAALDAAHAP